MFQHPYIDVAPLHRYDRGSLSKPEGQRTGTRKSHLCNLINLPSNPVCSIANVTVGVAYTNLDVVPDNSSSTDTSYQMGGNKSGKKPAKWPKGSKKTEEEENRSHKPGEEPKRPDNWDEYRILKIPSSCARCLRLRVKRATPSYSRS